MSRRHRNCRPHHSIENEQFRLDQRLAEARRAMEETDLGPSTRSIVEAAERRGIPWTRLDQTSFVRLGCKHSKMVEATIADGTRVIGVGIASDKELTKHIPADAGIPVPRGRVVHTAAAAIDAFRQVGDQHSLPVRRASSCSVQQHELRHDRA